MKRTVFFLTAVAGISLVLIGCPLFGHEEPERPALTGEWVRLNPADTHQFMEEEIHFTETEVVYFGAFGGPNALMPEKHEEGGELFPVFKGVYTVNMDVEPNTIDFTWTAHWPGEEEDPDFEPLVQQGIWNTRQVGHDDHRHVYLWINFGNAEERPTSWEGEIKFERVSDHDHEHDDDHDHEEGHDHH